MNKDEKVEMEDDNNKITEGNHVKMEKEEKKKNKNDINLNIKNNTMKNLTEQNPHKSATSEQLDVTPEDNKKKKDSEHENNEKNILNSILKNYLNVCDKFDKNKKVDDEKTETNNAIMLNEPEKIPIVIPPDNEKEKCGDNKTMGKEGDKRKEDVIDGNEKHMEEEKLTKKEINEEKENTNEEEKEKKRSRRCKMCKGSGKCERS